MMYAAKSGGFYSSHAQYRLAHGLDDGADVSRLLVELSDEEHARLLDEQAAGGDIVFSEIGVECQPAAAPSPAVLRQQAVDWLDATADRVRAADRSVGQYLDAEYQVVADALVIYRNDPDGDVPEAVQSYADAEGLTVKAAAEQIAEAAARAVDLLQSVRRIRLAGKAAVRDAADDADMLDIARPYIDKLEALATA